MPALLLQALAAGAVPWTVAAVCAAGLVAAGVYALRAHARAETAERKAQQLFAAHEHERLRLAQALHDGPVQDLLAYEMEASVAAYVGGAPEPGGTSVSDVVRDLRAVSEALRPPTLDAFGLAAAIHAHVERFRVLHPGISIYLDLDEDDLPLPTRFALFRIVHEALQNAAQHGPPLRIDVGFHVSETGAELTVSDDGNGYVVPDDLSSFTATGRYGVFGMQAQAESAGAEVSLESAPGRTMIRVTVPRERA